MNSRTRRSRAVLALGVAVVLILVGAILLIRQGLPHGEPGAAAPVPARDFVVAQPPNPVSGKLPAVTAGPDDGRKTPDDHARAGATQTPAAALPDNHLIVPSLHVAAAVAANPLNESKSLVLPEDVNRVTEWTGSAPIRAKSGTILVAGHVDNINQGTGALYWIHTLQPGDAVYLARNGVMTRWKVSGMQTVLKSSLPQAIWSGAKGPRQLVLVTCGGELVHDSEGRGNYTSNVVVTAIPF